MATKMATKKEIEKMFLLELLKLYKTMPVLWKVKSEDYHNRVKKADAYETLLKKYQEHFTTGTLDDLKKKINSLRTNFRNELRKMEKSAKSGAGSEDLYESQAWFVKAMMFLKDQETPATSISTLAENNEEEEEITQVS
ncbi:hypothetical protein ElyMa_006460500 [Elysia marginata]|uniref:MADF domain-containing protein n=1 Tax=Elysia marginata TaxID=1093978 RepID=A0AAV4I229_9GAST|nr:hypothetical protein ElyMa_006460500 [Elysia marginata]